MRKGHLSVAAAVAVLSALSVLAVTAVSASAHRSSAKPRVETQFSVIDVTVRQHRVGNHVVFHDNLYSTSDRDDLVGHLRGVITPCSSHRCLRLKARAHIFGQGYLKVRGKLQRGASRQRNNRFIIVGGSGAYNGAAGKVKVHNLPGRASLVTVDFVQ